MQWRRRSFSVVLSWPYGWTRIRCCMGSRLPTTPPCWLYQWRRLPSLWNTSGTTTLDFMMHYANLSLLALELVFQFVPLSKLIYLKLSICGCMPCAASRVEWYWAARQCVPTAMSTALECIGLKYCCLFLSGLTGSSMRRWSSPCIFMPWTPPRWTMWKSERIWGG